MKDVVSLSIQSCLILHSVRVLLYTWESFLPETLWECSIEQCDTSLNSASIFSPLFKNVLQSRYREVVLNSSNDSVYTIKFLLL